IRPPSQVVPIPQPSEAVFMRALDRSPTKRFLTVRQFVDEATRVGHGEVIELKQTLVMGRAGGRRPKGELVQTLLGVRGSSGLPPISSAPTVNPQPAATPVQQLAQAAMPAQPIVPSGQPAQPAATSGPPQMP